MNVSLFASSHALRTRCLLKRQLTTPEPLADSLAAIPATGSSLLLSLVHLLIVLLDILAVGVVGLCVELWLMPALGLSADVRMSVCGGFLATGCR